MQKLKTLKTSNLLGREFTIYGTAENPLFLAKDVAEMIEHSKADVMISVVDDNEKVKVNNVYVDFFIIVNHTNHNICLAMFNHFCHILAKNITNTRLNL